MDAITISLIQYTEADFQWMPFTISLTQYTEADFQWMLLQSL